MKRQKKTDTETLKSSQSNGNGQDPPVTKAYNLKLKSAEDVRRMLSIALNGLRRGEIAVPVARTLIYGGQVLLGVFEQCSLEDRIAALEEQTRYGGQR